MLPSSPIGRRKRREISLQRGCHRRHPEEEERERSDFKLPPSSPRGRREREIGLQRSCRRRRLEEEERERKIKLHRGFRHRCLEEEEREKDWTSEGLLPPSPKGRKERERSGFRRDRLNSLIPLQLSLPPSPRGRREREKDRTSATAASLILCFSEHPHCLFLRIL
uniref:Uncharacterized protein n=1 Tax=Nelumbo nucifera TaxID=4432 RepID=A0A822XAN1_NELNU|nr:TPA_asm: hypothetical protein HUJ06_019947 [Nelumbo nucifera]